MFPVAGTQPLFRFIDSIVVIALFCESTISDPRKGQPVEFCLDVDRSKIVHMLMLIQVAGIIPTDDP